MKVLKFNLIVFLLFLIIIEIVLRILGLGYSNAPSDNSNKLHHVHPKNSSFLSYDPQNNEYGGHNVFYDNYANRVNDDVILKNISNQDIWFFGDSFTEAIQVSWSNSFIGIYEDLLRINCINFGVSSYSPLLYYIQIQEAINNRKSPKKVFIQLYSNDYNSDNLYEKSTSFKNDIPIFCSGSEIPLLNKFFRKSYLIRLIRKSYFVIKYLFEVNKNQNITLNKNDESNHKNQINYKTKNFVEPNINIKSDSRFSKSVLQIKSLLEKNEIEYYFFVIPSKYSTLTGDWKANTFDKKCNDFFIQNNINYINLREKFQSNIDSLSLFYEIDIHLTKKGNKIVAEELINF